MLAMMHVRSGDATCMTKVGVGWLVHVVSAVSLNGGWAAAGKLAVQTARKESEHRVLVNNADTLPK